MPQLWRSLSTETHHCRMKKMNGKLLTVEQAPEGLAEVPLGTCAQVDRQFNAWLKRRGLQQHSMRETNDSIFAGNSRVLRDE